MDYNEANAISVWPVDKITLAIQEIIKQEHAQTTLTAAMPVGAALAFLWFPFDWLSEVCPAFGEPFRMVFRNAHDHLVGHSIFFLLIGSFVLFRIPILRRRPLWYLLGLIAAALIQETIQSAFRHEIPRFDDFNAFKGDALGGSTALLLFLMFTWFQRKGRPQNPTMRLCHEAPLESNGTETRAK